MDWGGLSLVIGGLSRGCGGLAEEADPEKRKEYCQERTWRLPRSLIVSNDQPFGQPGNDA